MTYSTTFDYGIRFQNEAGYYFKRQFIALVIGIAGIILFLQFDYQILRRISVVVLVGTLAMLVFVLLLGQF